MYKPVGAASDVVVEAHKVNSTWDYMQLSWSNAPSFNPTVEDYVIARGAGYHVWEITDIVRGWYEGENTGILFKASDTFEKVSYNTIRSFCSSDYSNSLYYPSLLIQFRNNNGLEDYWDYTATSAGRAGTGYVNNYTGNLVWTRSDLGFGGNRMPVSITHVYNANDCQNNSFPWGTAGEPISISGFTSGPRIPLTTSGRMETEQSTISNTHPPEPIRTRTVWS